MNQMKNWLRAWVLAFLAPRPLVGVFHLPRYLRQYLQYRRSSNEEIVRFRDTYPCLLDSSVSTPFDGHYFYQGAWLARLISDLKPERHVDVGSSVMMVSVLSALVETVFVDYRPLRAKLTGLTSIGASITNLPFEDGSIQSLSCLHVIEHIGLGRYGDPIDPEGSKKAARELERVLGRGGRLYLSLPVGRERVCFNAHRVHAPESAIRYFESMNLLEFSYVSDTGSFLERQSVQDANGSDYACGMYVFEKT